MDQKWIGITTCDSCRGRFRLREQHAQLEGKPVRCPRCHQEFILQIQRPSLIEEAAIENSEQQKSPKRRTMAQIRKEHVEAIKATVRSFHGRLQQITESDRSTEEEVRRWCLDVLRDGLGYADDEIDTELRALNKRVDIALRRKEEVFLVIECKNVRSRLGDSVVEQAVGYAASLSARWAVITNGHIWRLYRVIPVKGREPRVVQIFDVAFLDQDGVSDEDAESLYLLTSRAMFSGETERMFDITASTSDRQLLSAMTSERVVGALRRELIDQYRAESDQRVKLDDEVVEQRIRELFLPPDL